MGFMGIWKNFKGNFREVSRVFYLLFEESFKGVSKKFKGFFKEVFVKKVPRVFK